MVRKIMPAVVAVTAVALSLSACKTTADSSSSSDSSSSGNSSAATKLGPLAHAEDVTIDACTTDATLNAPVAHLTVTNHSSKPSDYIITIAFEDPAGNQLDTGLASVNSLQPGQSAKEDANSLKQGVNTTGMTCKIVEADRTSAVG